MAYEPDVLAKVKKHFEGKLRACPMCGTLDWNLEPDPYAFVKWSTIDPTGGLGKVDQGLVLPVVVLTCSNCALSHSYPLKQILRGQQDG